MHIDPTPSLVCLCRDTSLNTVEISMVLVGCSVYHFYFVNIHCPLLISVALVFFGGLIRQMMLNKHPKGLNKTIVEIIIKEKQRTP